MGDSSSVSKSTTGRKERKMPFSGIMRKEGSRNPFDVCNILETISPKSAALILTFFNVYVSLPTLWKCSLTSLN